MRAYDWFDLCAIFNLIMKKVEPFFRLLSISVFTALFVAACDKTEDPGGNPYDNPLPTANLEKWDIIYGQEYPEELWNYCMVEGNLIGFPKSEQFDYSDWEHTTSYLLIFNYRSFDSQTDTYVKMKQCERLHLFSKGDKKIGLSRLSRRAHAVSSISESLFNVPDDYKNIFVTSDGYYYCTEKMDMYDWSLFDKEAFRFDTSYDYFWMYVHDTPEPDTCQMLMADTNCISIPADYYEMGSSEWPRYTISSPFNSDLVMSGSDASWCWFYVQHLAYDKPLFDYSSTPNIKHNTFIILAQPNMTGKERKGKLTFHVEGHPEHTITLDVKQPAVQSGGGSGGEDNDDQNEKTFKVYPIVTVQRPNCNKESMTTSSFIRLYESYETDGITVHYKNGIFSTTIAGDYFRLRIGTQTIKVHDDECLGHPYISNGKILYYTYHNFIIKMTFTITGKE